MFQSAKLQSIIKNPWFIALILCGIFLLVTEYKYGWDDQHLEVPLLKHLIDDSYYEGDYYIESLQKNFSSFFYPILARLITVDQIPQAYFLLYLVSRYFLFYWIYKLWLYLSKDRFKAITCTLVFILMSRVDEFLYRTFSHQEFALAIIFAGIYYFFKERFYLAAILLGITTNLHALYSLFPMFFMCLYLLWQWRKHKFRTLIYCSLIYLTLALPFLYWAITNRLGREADPTGTFYQNWLELFINSCPQNFFFPQAPQIDLSILTKELNIFYYFTQSYILIIVLFLFNLLLNKSFRSNKKALCFSLGALALLIVSLIFTYFKPNRFVIDLNLTRNTQFLMFLLMGYTTLFIISMVDKDKPVYAFIAAISFTLLKYHNIIMTLSVIILFLTCLIKKLLTKKTSIINIIFIALSSLLLIFCAYHLYKNFNLTTFRFIIQLNLFIIFALLSATYFLQITFNAKNQKLLLKRLFIIIPVSIFLFQYGFYRQVKSKEEHSGSGFWELQRSWEDMQRFVRDHTQRKDIILVPYDMEMGGFRMISERKIVCSYRDCGIIGFDYKAAAEWRRRIKDIEPFKTLVTTSLSPAIKTAISKYNANYIVFMRYASPKKDNSVLQRVYTNSKFILFKVIPNSNEPLL